MLLSVQGVFKLIRKNHSWKIFTFCVLHVTLRFYCLFWFGMQRPFVSQDRKFLIPNIEKMALKNHILWHNFAFLLMTKKIYIFVFQRRKIKQLSNKKWYFSTINFSYQQKIPGTDRIIAVSSGHSGVYLFLNRCEFCNICIMTFFNFPMCAL